MMGIAAAVKGKPAAAEEDSRKLDKAIDRIMDGLQSAQIRKVGPAFAKANLAKLKELHARYAKSDNVGGDLDRGQPVETPGGNRRQGGVTAGPVVPIGA